MFCLLKLNKYLFVQIVSAVLVRVEKRKLLVTSGYQFIFYLLLLIAGIVPFHSYIYRATMQVHFSYSDIDIHLICFASAVTIE